MWVWGREKEEVLVGDVLVGGCVGGGCVGGGCVGGLMCWWLDVSVGGATKLERQCALISDKELVALAVGGDGGESARYKIIIGG